MGTLVDWETGIFGGWWVRCWSRAWGEDVEGGDSEVVLADIEPRVQQGSESFLEVSRGAAGG